MLMDRVLEPDSAHPLVRDLLESLRSSRFGEAHFSLQEIKRHLCIDHESIQSHLGFLLFANVLHSPCAQQGLQYLVDSAFDPSSFTASLMEYLALGNFFSNEAYAGELFHWLMNHGGMIEPESKAAWNALSHHYPEIFSINHSKHEARKLESFIRSQALEVREVNRL